MKLRRNFHNLFHIRQIAKYMNHNYRFYRPAARFVNQLSLLLLTLVFTKTAQFFRVDT